MPSRYLISAIVAFWLATAGWLFYREVLPWLQASAPPRLFQAEFSDEVRRTEIRWVIYRDKDKIGSPLLKKMAKIGSGLTEIKRQPDRTYALSTDLDFTNLEIGLPQIAGLRFGVKVQKIISKYVVGPKEELRELATEVTLDVNETWKGITLAMNGKVKDGRLAPHLHIRGLGKSIEEALDPVEVSARASFVNPMHLLHKVPDKLFEGRSWPVPLVDPMGDAAMAFLSKVVPLVKMMGSVLNMRIEKLFARVASGTFEWDGKSEDCWIIDYRRDPARKEIFARTWVRKTDQWILCQEAAFQGSRLVMVRLLMNREASQ